MTYRAMRLLLAAAMALLCASGAQAAPASPDAIEVDQPDGSSFEARLMGDEFGGWVETTDGYAVVEKPGTGTWEYAGGVAGGRLTGSGAVVRRGAPAPPGIQKGLRPERDKRRFRRFAEHVLKGRGRGRGRSPHGAPALVAPDGAGPGPQSGPGDWDPAPVSGTRNLLVVLVGFANRALVTSTSDWDGAVFSTSAGVKSVSNFYTDNSLGALTVSPAADTQDGGTTPGVVAVTLSSNHPNYGDNFVISTEKAWLQDALDAAGAYVDFPSFDTDGDGILQQDELVVYFIPSGYEAAGTSKKPSIWAHSWGDVPGLDADGVELRDWAMNGELNGSDALHPIGIMAHELGHSLCGLPDLYDPSGGNQGVGGFSLMSYGSWGASSTDIYAASTPVSLDAWSREFLGWSAPRRAAGSKPYSFPPPLSAQDAPAKLVNSGYSDTEYFLVENRYSEGWDLGLERWLSTGWGGGLLIMHIDNTVGTPGNNDINTSAGHSHQGVVVEQASTSAGTLMGWSYFGGYDTTLFYSGNNSSFGPATTPNSLLYGGADAGLSATSISARSDTMSAVLTGPDLYVTPTSAWFGHGGGSGSVSVSSSSSWTASSNASWITITSGSPGDGDGTVDYDVDPSSQEGSRTGTMTVAGTAVTVLQSGDPAYDDCPGARTVGALPYTDVDDTRQATASGSDPATSCWSDPVYNTVWYYFEPSADADVTVDTEGSSYDTVLAVFSGTCGSPSIVGCNDDINNPGGDLCSRVQFTALAGTGYYFMFGSYNDGGGKTGVINVYSSGPDDNVRPSSAVTDPLPGAAVPLAAGSYEIRGAASDAGSGVARVEVSVNGGAWQDATGTTSWGYSWHIPGTGNYTVRSRATDYAGNVEIPGAGVSFTVRDDSLELGIVQDGYVVTPTAVLSLDGLPAEGASVRFYYTMDGGLTWKKKGGGRTLADGSASKPIKLRDGDYTMKAVYEPNGAAPIESESIDFDITPVEALSPADLEITTDQSPEASWSPYPGAAGYVLQTSRSKGFKKDVAETADLGDVTTGLLPPLVAGQRSYWRVVALIPLGRSAGSLPRKITYREATSLANLDASYGAGVLDASASLSGADTGPMAGYSVSFYYKRDADVSWSKLGSATTGLDGAAALTKGVTLTGGQYDIRAYYKGDKAHMPQEELAVLGVP